MIEVGKTLPDVPLFEFVDVAAEGCSVGPTEFSVRERAQGKRIVIFGVPGAFTPTCSASHVPGYVQTSQALFDAGVDEIWCVSVNDAHVMRAWGQSLGTAGKVKMIADGNAAFARALGLDQDLTRRGMGIRSQRYAMVAEDGVVKLLAAEAPGKFEVSDADSIAAALKAMHERS
ncbi:peroxiredoxin [Trinickia sp.]|uniref:peroxiredoxin n=1 Tax=Trinickia sp. TaxID=2571163 RepID=UPI003F7CFFA0